MQEFRQIKVLEEGLKMLVKVMDKRLRKVATIGDAQFGFQSEKGTMDAMFILRQAQEKREKLLHS